MGRLKNTSFIVVLLTSILSFSSSANQTHSINIDDHLLISCNAFKSSSDIEKTLPCIIYIKGFFNGLINADNSKVVNIEYNAQKPSTIVERAYANRVGSRLKRKPKIHSCLPVDEVRDLIISRLSDKNAKTYVSVKQLNAFLINSLTASCSGADKSK
ncbi:hypothetical protein [Thalassotalea crassostreae]|uniref:hypothetical protein n=1 Tax=Thalassotalea crassostreae TaxID=1763536 RepID=UPI00139066C1|nr:hypothetical protein [Thalassotalea crassostreae]